MGRKRKPPKKPPIVDKPIDTIGDLIRFLTHWNPEDIVSLAAGWDYPSKMILSYMYEDGELILVPEHDES